MDEFGRMSENLTLDSVDLAATNGLLRTATLSFSTADLAGARLEFRVFVEAGIILSAFHIRTAIKSPVEQPEGHVQPTSPDYDLASSSSPAR
jgi:hypothetical protein